MAATSKDELSAVTGKEFGKLTVLLDQIGPDVALIKDDDDTSIKDIVGHRAYWIGLFFGWYEDGRAGRLVHLPAEGYRWNELKRYNADLRAAQSGMGWVEARALLEQSHLDLVGFIGEHSDDQLYGAPMAGGGNDWRPGRWAEAVGPSHYRSAAKYIRARLRAL